MGGAGLREGSSAGRGASLSVFGLASAAGWVALFVALCSVPGQRVWPIELVTHFWPQLIVTLVLSAAVAAVFGARRTAAAQGSVAALLLLLVAPHVRAFGVAGSADTNPLVIIVRQRWARMSGSSAGWYRPQTSRVHEE